MRFLKTLTLNRRAIYDSRVVLNTNDTFTVADSNNMVLPKSNNSLTSVQTEGMLRYNTTNHEVEVYSGDPATWRTLRYKESTQILRDEYAGDGAKAVFGPLTYQPPSTVESGATWTGNNLVVIVGNVYQVYWTNYRIELGSAITPTLDDPGPFVANQYYIRFMSASPGLSTQIVILHGFDQ